MLPILFAAITATTSIAFETTTATIAQERHHPAPLRYAKWAAVFDGGWSIALTAAWGLSARASDLPQPQGILGVAVARVLYGTTYSILLSGEIIIARLLSGEDWE